MEILVIGCGGLGCELVKILLQNPENSLTLVDDDTVDITNLNRQFLFTKEDIGKSKAETVARKIECLKAPETNVTAIFGNIKSLPHIEFYQQFSVVYCCLDNNETRSFVNQRCYASGVPMVDGGSAGWLGQSFFNGEECYDCLPKRQERVYPVCSIRQRPKSFEHCLVWGMEIVESKDIRSLRSEAAMPEDDAIADRPPNKRPRSSIDHSAFCIAELEARLESCEDKMELIYSVALLRARRFGINPLSLEDSQAFARKIIPSICTTNSIVASLMVLSRANMKNYYLVHGKVVRVGLNRKRSDCLTCSLPVYRCSFPAHASISDFFRLFGCESLLDENTLYHQSNEKLQTFDGRFGMVTKNGLHHRIYFEEYKGELSIKRIR